MSMDSKVSDNSTLLAEEGVDVAPKRGPYFPDATIDTCHYCKGEIPRECAWYEHANSSLQGRGLCPPCKVTSRTRHNASMHSKSLKRIRLAYSKTDLDNDNCNACPGLARCLTMFV